MQRIIISEGGNAMINDERIMKSFSEILSLLPADLPESEKAEAQRIHGNLKNLVGMEDDPKKEAERREHKKAVAEVCYIISNLDAEASARIPVSFKKYLEDQKWENYTPANLSRLRAEAYDLLDTVYRHFLTPREQRARLQFKYYIESCLQALTNGKQTVPLAPSDIGKYAQALQSVQTPDELTAIAKTCGLEKHLRFIMEKEEKITLLFS